MDNLKSIVGRSPVPEVRKRTIDRFWSHREEDEVSSLLVVLNSAVFHEMQRLKSGKHTNSTAQELQFWKSVRSGLKNEDDKHLLHLLESIVDRHLEEIDGNFSQWVYKFSINWVPNIILLLLNPLSAKDVVRGLLSRPDLTNFIKIRGKVETMKALSKKGTVILAPTHLSNMDSIILGWAIYYLGLPPFIYGAGLNLFTNRALSFFMNNLGAYKVDRKKTDEIYKYILKEYSTRAIELGRHSLFFPGGTRSRSGCLEKKLKLGLLGTGLLAYTNNLINRKENPNIFIFPCNMSYHMVLESETLIEDSLKQTGKARYIIEDDASSKPAQVINFIRKIVRFNSTIHVNIGSPIDPFGNRVNDDGASMDPKGREIDISRYVFSNGNPVHDALRDREYTLEMGSSILRSFKENNVILSTHIICFTLFRLLEERFPEQSIFQLMRTDPEERTLLVREIIPAVESLTDRVKELEDRGELKLDPRLRKVRPEAAFRHAARLLNYFEKDPALVVRDGSVTVNKPQVILYYHNRLTDYGLEKQWRGT